MKGSIQKRGTNIWRLVFDLERGAKGKRRQKAMTFHGSKKAAQAEMTQIMADIENNGFIDPSNLTVTDYLNRWLGHTVTKTSAKTHERYDEICQNNLIPGLGHLKLTNLRTIHIQQFYDEMLNNGRQDKSGGLSARTVHHIHRILSQALKQAVKWQVLPRNPADAVDPPKPARKEIRILDNDETAALLDVAKDTRLWIPIILAVTTGMRRGEILGLRWRDIDLDKCVLSVVQTLQKTRAGIGFKEPKTKQSKRNISLPEMTVEALRVHKARQGEIVLSLGCGWNNDSLVCSREDGRPIDPNTLTTGFRKLITLKGLRKISLHGLRHAHATHLCQAGISPKVVQERLGHSTITTTLDLYTHVMPGMQEDAAKKVDSVLRTALGKRLKNST